MSSHYFNENLTEKAQWHIVYVNLWQLASDHIDCAECIVYS